MGKPRLIILIRHAQSEGNKNREIHQMIPDHRVKLTEEGHEQAEEAGRRLKALLEPTDTIQIFTSPYRRTRETTEGILKTLTAIDGPDGPSPFTREKINVWEEPRIREQDFGNFQPCSTEMERMWAERADYGHFFYRIPDGESAADAYDRISGFNESLWRQFGDDDFPSVCVLVTHGLMTRVFLMKWYHWSVEYFEDLRNINHCEFIIMNKNQTNGKYVLENKLRTWSELKRQKQAKQEKEEKQVVMARQDPQRRNTLSTFLGSKKTAESPQLPPRKWGGCIDGCSHGNELYPRRAAQRKKQVEADLRLPPAAETAHGDAEDHPDATDKSTKKVDHHLKMDGAHDGAADVPSRPTFRLPFRPAVPSYLHPGRDGGGTTSGGNTPHEVSEDEDPEYFPATKERSLATAMRKAPERKATPEEIERWAQESGMGNGTKADALGDEPEPDEWSDEKTTSPTEIEDAEKEDKSLRGSVY